MHRTINSYLDLTWKKIRKCTYHVRDNFARNHGDIILNFSVERLHKGHWKNPLYTLKHS